MENVFLVRHAQSEANVDYKVLHKKTNMKVDLTHVGREQAKQTGVFLNNLLKGKKVIVWNSPFNRTRQTANFIVTEMSDVDFVQEESIYLIERNFGLVDAIGDYFDNPSNKDSIEYYKRHNDYGDSFFCKPPLGESPFDMTMRMHQFYNLYIEPVKDVEHIIVSHGASLRALNLIVTNQKFEKFVSQNPANASVNKMDKMGLKEIFCPVLRTS